MKEDEKEISKDELKSMLNSTDEGIFRLDLNGRCTFINKAAAAMSYYEPEELVNTVLHDILHHSYPDGSPYPPEECAIYKAFMVGKSCNIDNEVFWRRDGSSYPVEYSSYPIIEDGKVAGAVVTCRNIEWRIKAEKLLIEERDKYKNLLKKLQDAQAKLIEAEKMSSLGVLTAGIAHELNNPINFISANIQPLESDLTDLLNLLEKYRTIETTENFKHLQEEIQKFSDEIDLDFEIKEIKNLINTIKEGADRSTTIIKDLRTFARLDEDAIKKSNLHDDINSTLNLLHHRYSDHITIKKDYGDIPEIECFPGKINQVFMNILANAIDAIQGQGTITIKTQKQDDNIVISIKDSGMGMSPDVKEKIFQPFFTTKGVGSGTGLGLSIVYGIINDHNGSIEVNSEPNRGTEFIITLPIYHKKQV